MSPNLPEPEDQRAWPPPLDPVAVDCLNRTRAAVLNVIVVAGLILVVSGLAVREIDFGIQPLPPEPTRQVAFGVLFGLVVTSYVTRRTLSSRSSLRDPLTRGSRFYLAHVAGAILGALAVPLGFVYGVVVKPDIQEIAPFWVAGMALGFLALPRGHELADFDEPMREPGRRPHA